MGQTTKKVHSQSFTLASGTTSEVIELQGRSLFGIITPASLSSTTMTFTACDTKAGTYVGVNDDAGNAISITVAASKVQVFINKHLALRCLPYVKCVMGSSETSKTMILLFIEE